MKKLLALILCSFLLGAPALAQKTFKPGYYVTNTGEKISGLIQDMGWAYSPTEISFRNGAMTPVQTFTISDLQEFGIDGGERYIRKTVLVERTRKDRSNPDYEGEVTTIKNEILWLEVLIDGEAALYRFHDREILRYYIHTQEAGTVQLGHKPTWKDEERVYDDYFKEQLFNSLPCEEIIYGAVKELEFREDDLRKFFIRYYDCQGKPYTQYGVNNPKERFHVSVRPGVHSASLWVDNNLSNFQDAVFPRATGFRLGLECEFVLPFASNTWSVIVEPTYQQYRTSTTSSSGLAVITLINVDAKYTSVEVPVGLRYRWYVHNSVAVYASAGAVLDITLDSYISYTYEDGRPQSSLVLDPSINYFGGVGVELGGRIQLEGRYYTPRNVMSRYIRWQSEYQALSAVLGYRVF